MIRTKTWVGRCGKKEIDRQFRGPGLAYYISPPRDFSNFVEDPLHAFCYILFVPSPQAKKRVTLIIYFLPLKDFQLWNHLLELNLLFLAMSPLWCCQGWSLAQYAPNTLLRRGGSKSIGEDLFFWWCMMHLTIFVDISIVISVPEGLRTFQWDDFGGLRHCQI